MLFECALCVLAHQMLARTDTRIDVAVVAAGNNIQRANTILRPTVLTVNK